MTADAGLRPLANVYEHQAEPGWRSIDFISDLHLSPATPRRRPGSFAQRAADVLRDAAARRPVGFMAGNRDFLVGAALLRDCGVMALPDPTLLDAWGQRVLLTHGDELCLDDTTYQKFRAEVRSDAWRQAFLDRPLAEREQIARRMRDASEDAKRGKPIADGVDVDTAAAVSWMHAAGSHALVHGHTHRPGSEALAPGFVRHVLSDWDCEAALPRAQALRLTRDGFTRIDLAAV
jgi:UDP-2,3-diacylglucosamine hydrolase